MSTPNQNEFVSIDTEALETVAGAASSSSNDQLTATLTQITSSIKDLANTKNNSSMDPMQMMLMMMMMGGGGGGGVVAAPGVGVAAQPIINVGVRAGGGCFRRGKGKKGW